LDTFSSVAELFLTLSLCLASVNCCALFSLRLVAHHLGCLPRHTPLLFLFLFKKLLLVLELPLSSFGCFFCKFFCALSALLSTHTHEVVEKYWVGKSTVMMPRRALRRMRIASTDTVCHVARIAGR
jgi:hypothetical protein